MTFPLSASNENLDPLFFVLLSDAKQNWAAMDKTRFGESATGELVRIELPGDRGRDWAFVPNPLPRQWRLPTGLADLLGDAREALGTLNGIGQTLVQPTLLLRPLRQREAIRSSSLEGTDVLAVELLQYQLDPKQPHTESEPRNSWLEVSNHDAALTQGLELLTQLPLCGRLVRELHRTLLRHVRGRDKMPGQFRKSQVYIGSDRRFVPPPPSEVPRLMADLDEYLNRTDAEENPLVRAYIAHYQFEAIHPFLDGNGRIGRVLLSLCTYLWNRHDLPWLYMSAYFDRHKDEYVENLFAVSAHGAWDRWVEFCLRGTIEQCRDAIARCKALGSLRDEYHARLDDMSPRMHRIVDALFTSPVFRVKDLMGICGVTRPTAQKDADLLVAGGVASRLRGERPRTYFVPRIMRTAFEDDPADAADEGDLG